MRSLQIRHCTVSARVDKSGDHDLGNMDALNTDGFETGIKTIVSGVALSRGTARFIPKPFHSSNYFGLLRFRPLFIKATGAPQAGRLQAKVSRRASAFVAG